MTGLPEHVRAFTAIELDGSIRRALAKEGRTLFDGVGRLSVVPEANLHVTLKFLGDVHRDDLAALGETLEDAAALLREGEVEVGEVGAFPHLRRPRVIWAGVSDPEGILTPVHSRLNETLARFGAKREKKRYVPHVTLARVRGPFDARLFSARLERSDGLWFGTQRVDRVTLFMSELDRAGPPRYTVLGRYGP
ncbi:MAG: RNA 2',3'-cyclic phosphodiesterase [Planctomycetota bacterium]|jgi:2'-5' RNA ligase